MKAIRKVRLTYMFYLPPWDRREFGLLLAAWDLAANEMMDNDQKDLRLKVKTADLVFTWYSGIPRVVWDGEWQNLKEACLHSEYLANIKLQNISFMLQSADSHLFHFNLKPGARFKEFQYTFCSEKVANLYTEYLCRANVNEIRSFLEAFQPFREYSVLRGFVFEQYVIRLTLLTASVVPKPRIGAWMSTTMKLYWFSFLLLDSYCGFKFQKYRSSRKVSQKAVRVSFFTRDCADVPVSGSPYVEEMSDGMDVVSIDADLLGTWEEALGCKESEETFEDPLEKSLVQVTCPIFEAEVGV
ncbi:hypothetical protein SELMODRAFT_432422 [Selaginella moellendorffii]|uniref:Uncharacterized protein n=1 Tax=Selaginella moellendorffii TaxID=88036 RepID=D8TFY5_SELML|nr:hypothetical protein SELMODRAFT_432422 [Selaginella moellendorffii]